VAQAYPGIRVPSCPEIDPKACSAFCEREFGSYSTRGDCINYSLMLDVFDDCWTTSPQDSEKAFCVLPICIRGEKPETP
jgi:hypothetical protein